jgi:hypothetical protein
LKQGGNCNQQKEKQVIETKGEHGYGLVELLKG